MARHLLFWSLAAMCVASVALAQEEFSLALGDPLAEARLLAAPNLAVLDLASMDLDLPKACLATSNLDVTGAENNDPFDPRFNGQIKRKTDDDLLTAAVTCRKDTNGSTANEGVEDLNYQWLVKTSRLTWFVHETAGYCNQFDPCDLHMEANGGLGLRLINSDSTTLVGRFGGSSACEKGFAGEQWTPEIKAGLEIEHKLDKLLKFSTSAEYIPSMADATDLRARRGRGMVAVELSPSLGLPLKLVATDSYDSSAALYGGRTNSVGYSALLTWKY